MAEPQDDWCQTWRRWRRELQRRRGGLPARLGPVPAWVRRMCGLAPEPRCVGVFWNAAESQWVLRPLCEDTAGRYAEASGDRCGGGEDVGAVAVVDLLVGALKRCRYVSAPRSPSPANRDWGKFLREHHLVSAEGSGDAVCFRPWVRRREGDGSSYVPVEREEVWVRLDAEPAAIEAALRLALSVAIELEPGA